MVSLPGYFLSRGGWMMILQGIWLVIFSNGESTVHSLCVLPADLRPILVATVAPSFLYVAVPSRKGCLLYTSRCV
ncbi:hypothetical protein CBR_g26418 [Chara braunii]|uniref:Uncharacterized protein n=1 Tax=Chara braunii TaxID=69332 RepID=A0A388L7V7_CHABU|nr:hypothetical protein CBR_g26418 [Chara braunii]|eukprot:GBG78390.1 hypothetical protein CBR_g26418 [Chara braunii]